MKYNSKKKVDYYNKFYFTLHIRQGYKQLLLYLNFIYQNIPFSCTYNN